VGICWPVVPDRGRPPDKALASALTTSLAYLLRDLLLMPRVDPADDLAGREDRPAQQQAVPPVEKPKRAAPPPGDPTTGQDFAAWVDRLDRQLARDGLAEPGALIDWLTSRARIEAPPLPVRWEEWPAQVVAVYVAEARKFARIRRLDREKADAAPK